MDKTNEIKTDRLSMKEVKKKKPAYDDDDEDEDDYDEDEDEYDEDEDEDDDDGAGNGQCPECTQASIFIWYEENLNSIGPTDGFKCNATNPAHLFCSSCYQPFADRRTQFPQSCKIIWRQ